MIYNLDFLIAGLVFLCILLLHFLEQRRFDPNRHRTFLRFLLIGMLDLLFDLITSVLISRRDANLAWLLHSTLLIFYLLQVMVPYALQIHLLELYSRSARSGRRNLLLWSVMPALMMAFIVVNLWTGQIYSVDAGGGYVHGPLYSLMYIYTLFYFAAIVLFAVAHRRSMGARRFGVVGELVLIAGVCVSVQMLRNEILLTGFGIALGITVYFLNMNNPYLNTDSLTGAFDAKYMHERIQTLMIRGSVFHLLSVELAQLHQINLVYNSEMGDGVLVNCARRMQATGKRNLVFRISGRRFLMICFSISDYERALRAMEAYDSLRAGDGAGEIACPLLICGVAHAERFSDSASMMDYLDYLAQLVPRCTETCVVQDNDRTRRGFRREQMIEQYLPKAIHDDLFELRYQPVYSLSRGEYDSIEVLSRLQHPTLGAVSPEVFIRIAERNDMIANIDLLQLRRACRFLKEHPEVLEGMRSVKFNLSPLELMKPGHAQALIQVIRGHGLRPELFQFELTETAATEHSEVLEASVRAFAEAKIGLCLDDFGSGYANLNTVLRLPFATIKLDRSLLSGISENVRVASFYENIAGMLINMGYEVVAEGVETEAELELVRKWGIDLVQGFYFSDALRGEALVERLRAG